MNDQKSTIQKIREKVLAFRDERNWKQFHNAKDLTLAMGIEVGELAELFLWRKNSETKLDLQDDEFLQRVKEEMADIQMLLLCLSDVTKVDLAKAVEKKPTKKCRKISCR